MRAAAGGRDHAWCAPVRRATPPRSDELETCDATRPTELGSSAIAGLVVHCLHRSDCSGDAVCTLSPHDEGDFYQTRCESLAHLAEPDGNCVPEADYCKPPWCLSDAQCADLWRVGARCLPLAGHPIRVCQLP